MPLQLFAAGGLLYLSTLWGVKISVNLLHIQLTRRFGRVHLLARFTLYILLGSILLIFLMYFLACWPVQRRWTLSPTRQCPPIAHAWDFVRVGFTL